MNELEIYQQPGHLTKTEIREFKINLETYEKMIDKKPLKIQHDNRGNYDYIDIDLLESELNKYFFGLWNWTIDDTEIVVNEIIVRGTLEVFHPVAGIWLKRSGIGACQIRMKEKAPLSEGINAKLKTALQMDAPHAAAEAFKNAAAKYGRIFGRGLRRDLTTEYSGFNLEPITELTKEQKETYDNIIIEINNFSDSKELAQNTEALLDEDLPDSAKKELRKIIQQKYDKLAKENNE